MSASAARGHPTTPTSLNGWSPKVSTRSRSTPTPSWRPGSGWVNSAPRSRGGARRLWRHLWLCAERRAAEDRTRPHLWACAETRAAEAADAAPSVGLCGDMRGRRPDAPLSRHHLWPCAERRAAEGRTQLEFVALCGETYRPGVAAVG